MWSIPASVANDFAFSNWMSLLLTPTTRTPVSRTTRRIGPPIPQPTSITVMPSRNSSFSIISLWCRTWESSRLSWGDSGAKCRDSLQPNTMNSVQRS